MEPPDGYVAFVGRHLEPLRRDAAGVVGDAADAHRLYPDVLTDVAARWRWLELLRTRLGRADVADEYLRDAFVRRSQRWHADQEEPVEIQVWDNARGSYPPPRPVHSSAATRLAPFVRSTKRVEVGAFAEAAVAWWHAYEARRRRRIIALLATVALAMLLAIRYLQSTGY